MSLFDFLNFDLVINKDCLQNLPKEKVGGIYFFFDDYGDIIYIGKTNNIQLRVRLHFTGQTHSVHFSYLFKDCGIIFVSNECY